MRVLQYGISPQAPKSPQSKRIKKGLCLNRNVTHTWEVPNYAAISWTGETIAAIDRFGTVDLWKPHSSTQLHTLTTSFTKPITTLAFAHNGKSLQVAMVLANSTYGI